jgi:hypothetical protein
MGQAALLLFSCIGVALFYDSNSTEHLRGTFLECSIPILKYFSFPADLEPVFSQYYQVKKLNKMLSPATCNPADRRAKLIIVTFAKP